MTGLGARIGAREGSFGGWVRVLSSLLTARTVLLEVVIVVAVPRTTFIIVTFLLFVFPFWMLVFYL